MEAIFADVLPNVVIVENEAGQIYDPSTGTNTIGNWNQQEAYLVNVNSPVTLIIDGTEIVPEVTPITLDQGWNLVPYLRIASLSIGQVLAPIILNVVLAKNRVGEIYYPDFGIDTIGDMLPGEGYKIYVDQATTLTYPPN